eukprot:6174252-Pleurochrysis_carterae.AAC.2
MAALCRRSSCPLRAEHAAPAPQPAVRAPRSLRSAQRSPQQGARAAPHSPRPARPSWPPRRARASASP